MSDAPSTGAMIIETGSRNSNPGEWTPFEWDDPVFGKQVKGEVTGHCQVV